MGVSDAPIANSVDEYIKLAIEYANSDKLFEIKERYRKAAERTFQYTPSWSRI